MPPGAPGAGSIAPLGSLEQADGRWWLSFTRWFDGASADVWPWLVHPDLMQAWFPCEVRGERAEGARLEFRFEGDPEATGSGEVLLLQPMRAFVFSWGDEEIELHLAEVDGLLRLTFVDSFEEVGKAARDAAGWHVCLDLLAGEMSGQPLERDPHELWREVHPAYVAAFGPEASALGPPAP